MKKRSFLLIPVTACLLASAASNVYIQYKPEVAPERAAFLTKISELDLTTLETGSAAMAFGSADTVIGNFDIHVGKSGITFHRVEDKTIPPYKNAETKAHTDDGEQISHGGSAEGSGVAKQSTILPDQQRAEELTAAMTLEQKLYQMMFLSPEGLTDSEQMVTRAGDMTREYMMQRTVGGILYQIDQIQSKEQIAEMLGNTQKYATETEIGFPIFAGVDASAISEAVMQPEELPSVGFQVDFVSGPETPDTMLSAMYYDPEEGDGELPGTDIIIVTGNVAETIDEAPCCLSEKVVRDIVRQEGFTGIILSDRLDSDEIAEEYGAKAAVMAIQAGVDMVLCPADTEETYAALEEAVKDGTIPMEQIDASVARILLTKISKGMI